MKRRPEVAGRKIVYGTILHFLFDPGDPADSGAWQLFEDGALVIGPAGTVEWVGEASMLPCEHAPRSTIVDFCGYLIVPGFVDTHVHAGQVDVIASYGEQLLEWLQKYVFPVERRFLDAEYATTISSLFLDTLLAAGTTTATVFPTVHKESVDAFCAEATRRNLRMICGKVLMDRAPIAPDFLRDTTIEQAEQDCRELIDRWHRKGRLNYSFTPRFALSSTEQLLAMVGRLRGELPDAWLQTHAAENLTEVELIRDMFGSRSYVDVYDRYGMLGPRSIYAHCLHVDDLDRARLAETGAAISFCPTSNLFLGSGLFGFTKARAAGIRVGLGTDIGAGTSYSLLHTLNHAYKVVALTGGRLSAWRGFYLATLGGAEALYLDDVIGNFQHGKEADFVVLDWAATPVLKRRTEIAKDFQERLFALMILGDERAVRATYVMGEQRYDRQSEPLVR